MNQLLYTHAELQDAVARATFEVLRDPAGQLDSICAATSWELCRDLHELFRRQDRAQTILQQDQETFPGQRRVAAKVLADVLKKRKQLHAALHVLDFGSPAMRKDFILESAAEKRLIDYVIRAGGIYHRRHRNDVPGVWVELPE